MADQIEELISLLNKLRIDELMQHLRKTFYEYIELKRKRNSEFSTRLENAEKKFFNEILVNENNSNLKYRLRVYNSLDNFKFQINELKEIINIIFILQSMLL